MKWTSFMSLSIAMTLLGGCSSIVKNNVYYPNSVKLDISGATDSEILEFYNLEEKKLALNKEENISYLWGDSTKITDSYNPPTFKFTATYKGAPPGVQSVRLHNYNAGFVDKPETTAKGLVILLHSYGTSSNSVLVDNAAFQVKGYKTAIIDLLGHGKNNHSPASFGLKDIERLHFLITQLREDNNLPLLLYGKSYGASIAAQYIEAYGNVDGFIAVAPLTNFTKAAVTLSKSMNPILKMFISDEWLEKEVEKTLNTSQVSSEEISTPNVLKRLPANRLPPTLVLTSSIDKVSNREDVAGLAELNGVTLINISDHTHVEMMIFDDEFDQHINDWLTTRF